MKTRTTKDAMTDGLELVEGLSAATSLVSSLALIVLYTPGANLIYVLPWLLIDGNSTFFNFIEKTPAVLTQTSLVSFGVFATSKVARGAVNYFFEDRNQDALPQAGYNL